MTSTHIRLPVIRCDCLWMVQSSLLRSFPPVLAAVPDLLFVGSKAERGVCHDSSRHHEAIKLSGRLLYRVGFSSSHYK